MHYRILITKYIQHYNFSGAKAPPFSSWDTGRVAPFIEVLLTEKMSSVVLLTDRIFIFYKSDVFIGYWLLTDGISIFYMSVTELAD